jgi:hypothetical protein
LTPAPDSDTAAAWQEKPPKTSENLAVKIVVDVAIPLVAYLGTQAIDRWFKRGHAGPSHDDPAENEE